MKHLLIGIGVLVVIGLLAFLFLSDRAVAPTPDETPDATDPIPTEPDEGIGDTPEENEDERTEPVETIGQSTDGTAITAYHYGEGDTEVLFVGGIHGGYSYNTALVAYDLMDYLDSNPNAIPDNVMVTVIPVLNPDGLSTVLDDSMSDFTSTDITASETQLVAARFNANNVDINRNFDCEWEATGTWQSRTVSGGSAPFSEPESRAIRDYVESSNPAAVVAFYSAAGGVFASTCQDTAVLPETTTLTNLYADAAGYQAYEEFDFYEITGDMVNWVAKNNIPAISVLLSDRQSAEWSKNQAGVDAVLQYYAE